MPKRIQAFPSLRQHRQSVQLDGVSYFLVLTWRERLQSWYMDLYTNDNTPVYLGRRLSPQWSPNANLSVTNGPPGLFWVVGPDPYNRVDLGGNLRLYYYTAAELGAS